MCKSILQSIRSALAYLLPIVALCVTVLAAVLLSACACATTSSGTPGTPLPVSKSAPIGTRWTWKYISYHSLSGLPQPGGGKMVLTRTVDGFTALVHIANPDQCVRGDMPAQVHVADGTIVIVTTPITRACPEFRYTIRIDGTGGVIETRRPAFVNRLGDQIPATVWVKNARPNGLTPL